MKGIKSKRQLALSSAGAPPTARLPWMCIIYFLLLNKHLSIHLPFTAPLVPPPSPLHPACCSAAASAGTVMEGELEEWREAQRRKAADYCRDGGRTKGFNMSNCSWSGADREREAKGLLFLPIHCHLYSQTPLHSSAHSHTSCPPPRTFIILP